MDVKLFSCAGHTQANSLHVVIGKLGYPCDLFSIADMPTHIGCSATCCNILYLESCFWEEFANKNQCIESLTSIDIVLIDSLDLVRKTCLFEKTLDVSLWPIQENELKLRLLRVSSLRQIHTHFDIQPITHDLCLEVNMIGCSHGFVEMMYQIKQFSKNNANVLILGETGTGKELAARAIHNFGRNNDGPFQAVNCGALPEYLIENELFGHEKGAYTDARTMESGIIEQAIGGTLFLDEIDALSLKSQSSLLRFLQDKVYRPLGARQEKKANIKIIAATNVDLEESVRMGNFRKDLFYRLTLLTIRVPTLQERKVDIPLLARYFLRQCGMEFGQGNKYFHPLTMYKMLEYTWPGNIRELNHFVQRAYLLANGTIIVGDPNKQSLQPISKTIYPENNPSTSFAEAKQQVIELFEQNYIVNLLSCTHGNVTKAAAIAGKERRAFGKLVKKYGINRFQFS